MQIQPPSRELQIDALPRDGPRRRAPHPLVSLGVAAIVPATLFVSSALLNHPGFVLVALSLALGATTGLRLSPSR